MGFCGCKPASQPVLRPRTQAVFVGPQMPQGHRPKIAHDDVKVMEKEAGRCWVDIEERGTKWFIAQTMQQYALESDIV